MKSSSLLPLLASLLCALAGCSDDDDAPPTARDLRVVHASLGTGPVELLLDEVVLLTGLEYQQASPQLSLTSESGDLQLDVIDPSGNITLIGPVTVDFAVAQTTNVLAVGDAGSTVPLVFGSPRDAVALDEVRLQVVHAVPAVGPVDVYITVVNADLAASAPFSNPDFGGVSSASTFAAGTWQIRVTEPGTPSAVVFDSGPVEFPGGGDQLVVVVPSVAAGSVPVSLFVADGSQGEGGYTIVDRATPGEFRFVNGVLDAPELDVQIDQVAVLSGLDYAETSELIDIAPGQRIVRADGAVPGGGTQPVVRPAPVDAVTGQVTSFLAVGSIDSGVQSVVVQTPRPQLLGDELRVQVVHGAPAVPAVRVYVTAPGADLTQATPLATLEFRDVSDTAVVPGGSYQVRLTEENDPQVVLFDSGPLEWAAWSDLLVTAVPALAPRASDAALLVADGSEPAGRGVVVRDVMTPAQFRVVHGSPDAVNIDVVLDDDFANPLITDLAFGAVSTYEQIAAAVYNVKLVETGTQNLVLELNLGFTAGQTRSIHAAGLAASVSAVDLTDDVRRISTEARLRLIHLSPAAGLVDVYITAPGANITGLEPDLRSVALGDESGYLGLAAGGYDLTFTTAGTKNPVLILANVSVATGGIYTAAVRDNAGGGLPLGAILMDDL